MQWKRKLSPDQDTIQGTAKNEPEPEPELEPESKIESEPKIESESTDIIRDTTTHTSNL